MPRKVISFTVKWSVQFLITWLFHLVQISETQNCIDTNLQPGNCVQINSCPQLIQDYYDAMRSSSYFNDFQNFISGSVCGFDGYNFMVCCVTSRIPQGPALPNNFNTVATQQSGPNTLTFKFSSLDSNGDKQIPPQLNPTDPPSQLVTPSLIPPANIFTPSNTKGVGNLPANPTSSVLVLPSLIPNINSTDVNTTIRLPSLRGRESCGLTSAYTNKVVGGSEASRGAYPWLVALGYRDEYKPNTLKFLCGGSLISSRYVLTSGHCINALLSTVRLGAHDLSNANEEGAINIPVERKIVHEQYDARYVINDIGLVQLSAAAPNTAYIFPICLPEGERFKENFVGMNPFVAGWGAVKFQGPSSNVLRDVQVPIVSQESCKQSYSSVFRHIIFTDRFICAGNSYVDACQGDSGGPLMMPMLENGAYHYYILGLVSYGYECARAGFPGVYTRVASYIPWIRTHMT